MCPSCCGQNVESFDLLNPELQLDGDSRPTKIYIRVRVHHCQDCSHAFFWRVDGDALVKRYEEARNLDATVGRISRFFKDDRMNYGRTQYHGGQDMNSSEEDLSRLESAVNASAVGAGEMMRSFKDRPSSEPGTADFATGEFSHLSERQQEEVRQFVREINELSRELEQK